MLAAELIATHQFRLAEMSDTDPGPGEVQVRVAAVGVCGSDIHYYSEGAVGDTPCVFPMVMGHEPSGTVVKCGAGVTGWHAGDRAALEPALYCYHCEFCRTGHHNVCANIRFLSTPGYPGFFREYVNLPAANLLAIPPGMSLELATVVEPLAVALHSMQFAALGPDDTVAVIGAGPIGLLTVACAKLRGVKRIWAIDPVAAPARIGQGVGRRRGDHPWRTGRGSKGHRRPRRGLRYRLRGEIAHHERRHSFDAQRGPRSNHGNPFRYACRFRDVAAAAEGINRVQRSALQSRVAGGAGNDGAAAGVVCALGNAHAAHRPHWRSI